MTGLLTRHHQSTLIINTQLDVTNCRLHGYMYAEVYFGYQHLAIRLGYINLFVYIPNKQRCFDRMLNIRWLTGVGCHGDMTLSVE